MRVGMSWRVGRGRRQWVSMGPIGWLFVGPILLMWRMLELMIWLMVMLCVWYYQGTAWIVRTLWRLGRDLLAARRH